MDRQVNGITLHYEEYGQGMPVVLVHAFPLGGVMWQPQIEPLAAAWRLIIPDMRGFGASDAPAGPYPMQTCADDIAALLDELGIQQAVIGGLSMGGYISFAFLRRFPSRVRALVLADTRATADSAEAKAGRETNAQLVESQGARAIAEKMLPSLLAPAASEGLKAHVRGIIQRNRPQGIAGALRGMALRPDSSDLLPQIRVPTLLLVGSEDNLTSPAEMRTLESSIAGSRLVTIPGAAHLSNMENPPAFTSALSDFLRAVEGS